NSMAVHSKDFKAEKTYQRLMWIGGFENVVAHWLKGGMKETPKEMAAYCIQYLPHMLQEGTFS
ncbi:MAG: TetR family transcriptional regulator C-terminal domain-containing protein, partial [Lachnospiraceae bacterium]|nr:TetR family transcriptional regulator C-terminal domain-containing protein [Lachnospiraceae bacterium]